MRYDHLREARVDYERCDICGESVRAIGIELDGQSFQPVGGASHLFPHPFRASEHACSACLQAKRHLDGRTPAPAGMLLAKVYEITKCFACKPSSMRTCRECYGHGRLFLDDSRENREEHGLRLPARPYTAAEWEKLSCCGVILHPARKDRALVCTMRWYWWHPAYVFDGSRSATNLSAHEGVMLFVEPSARTPFRTVYEAKLAGEISQSLVREHYGAGAAERMTEEHDAIEVALRVPMEILQ